MRLQYKTTICIRLIHLHYFALFGQLSPPLPPSLSSMDPSCPDFDCRVKMKVSRDSNTRQLNMETESLSGSRSAKYMSLVSVCTLYVSNSLARNLPVLDATKRPITVSLSASYSKDDDSIDMSVAFDPPDAAFASKDQMISDLRFWLSQSPRASWVMAHKQSIDIRGNQQ